MYRCLVAQIGARRHYSVPRALAARGMLHRFVTDAAAGQGTWRLLERFVPQGMRPAGMRRALDRTVPGVPAEAITTFPWFALSGRWDRRRGESDTDRWARRNAAFGRRVVQAGFGEADTVYAFNAAALEIFQAARQAGLRTVLDQTAAPWRWNTRLLREEAERWPGWEEQPAETDASGRLSEREEAEWALADRIVCGSAFAAQAVAETGGPAERCSVVPYPSPQGFAVDAPRAERRLPGAPLRVLFVGTLQLRKGVPYLLETARLLRGENVVFRLVGPSRLSEAAMRELRAELEAAGAVPRSELAAHYAWSDVFVLPTLSEGSANVCYEAMAAGVPVVTTPSAGAPIQDTVNGLLVPTRDPQALAEAILRLQSDDHLRTRLAASARAEAHATAFGAYADQLAAAVASPVSSFQPT